MPAARKPSLIMILVLGSFFFQSQMPEWKYFKDREGNTYFIDQAGKIRITDVGKYRYKPVSAKGIDYYLHYGITLINDHRLTEGLSVLKSILALPADNNRIYDAQAQAAKMVNSLKKREGTRYSALDESAALILFRRNSFITIINDRMLYSFQVPAELEVVRVMERAGAGYRYSGLLMGIWKPDMKSSAGSNGRYDMLLAVDSEKFSVPFKDLAQAIERWRYNLGFDDLQRKKLLESETRVIYHFKKSGTARYEGAEGIITNGRFSYCIRLITSEANYQVNTEMITKILDGFEVVSKAD
ncbi:MAG: hypothetical protein A2W19_10950 [Spirochaetes bacterium RBG_16_49_21]|nr:MAG: hypothetical protein A2W19_10950 [Spirochaetes bacterium RBG_16_49_21]